MQVICYIGIKKYINKSGIAAAPYCLIDSTGQILLKREHFYMECSFFIFKSLSIWRAKKYLYGMEEKKMAEEKTATSTATAEAAEPETKAAETPATETTEQAKQPALSSEEIQKMIQSTVDTRTAELGKTIADLKKENLELKKKNMTAEEIQKADKEEFEKQKAEVELQKRQIYAHRIVANAGYGDNAEAVVDIILGDTDDKTKERLDNFKSLVDKLVAETVQKTFKANGRLPNGGNANGDDTKKETNIAAELGKKKAETQKQSNDILKHYYGG